MNTQCLGFCIFLIITVLLRQGFGIIEKEDLPLKDQKDLESQLAIKAPIPVSKVSILELEHLDNISAQRASLVFEALPDICKESGENRTDRILEVRGIGKTSTAILLKSIDFDDCPTLLQKSVENAQ